jgi:hypothetical protein
VTDVATIRPQSRVPAAALVPYVLITFAITWGIAGLYIFLPERAVAWFGEIAGTHPLYIMATWAPAFAAFAVVGFFGGRAGLKAYLTRLALWRCSIGWGAFLLIGVPLTFAAGALVKGTLADPLPFDSLGSALEPRRLRLFQRARERAQVGGGRSEPGRGHGQQLVGAGLARQPWR